MILKFSAIFLNVYGIEKAINIINGKLRLKTNVNLMDIFIRIDFHIMIDVDKFMHHKSLLSKLSLFQHKIQAKHKLKIYKMSNVNPFIIFLR